METGLDIPFNADIDASILEAKTPEEVLELAIPEEAKMNTTYIGIANSLVTVEYYESESVKNISSASREGVESTLVTLNNNPATRRLDINFKKINLQIKVHITFNENSITYDIKEEDVTGSGKSILMAVNISPFLGASGGKNKLYNPETGMYDIEVDKYRIPGYVFVPDGSGSLIRFQDNTTSFTEYIGDVYGEDHAQAPYYTDWLTDAVPLKNPVMPVFGIAHGNDQAAFVAYADHGAEYMKLIVKPEENMTYYYQAYPSFVYNVQYYQVYNKKGEGYFSLMENPNKFHVNITYEFLAGDGSDGTPAADYTGMALAYRSHLIEQGILTPITSQENSHIPIRLDFVMGDSKKGIVGTDEVVVTSVKDIDWIMNNLIELGITNINSGIYGWQRGGETMATPGSKKYSKNIGKEKDYKKLFEEYKKLGIDISYARDYVTINPEMVNYNDTAVKHVNSWYLVLNKSSVLPESVPIHEFGYATPKKSISWVQSQYKRTHSYINSMTIGGISEVLLSNYDSGNVKISVTETISLYEETLEAMNSNIKLNFENPNMYLWKYTDRYLQSPVGNSQYVFQTDAVPFLQMVLHGTMEMYGPYSNFSFYTKSDILRMIDYNISPSFILTEKPSYHLAATPSADLYSTEYIQYETLIKEVYETVNQSLSQVIGYEWVDRQVLENGVILNQYRQGSTSKSIIINYTDEQITYENTTVAPLSALVLS